MDIMKVAAEKAEQAKRSKEIVTSGRVLGGADSILERARAAASHEEKTSLYGSTPVSPGHHTIEVSVGVLMEDHGWEEMAQTAAQFGVDPLEVFGVSKRHGEALDSLKQVLNTKPGRTTRIPKGDWETILDFIPAMQTNFAKMEAAAKEKAKAMKHMTVSFPGEHGDLFVDATAMKLMTASVKRGKHMLLIGEPGAGKTDVARALAPETGRKLFHMEVSGLSDVSQLEAERYLEVQDGASVTVSKPTALIEALEAAADGEQVVLVVDEVARVVDPAILNPLLLLMSHGEYHAVVAKKTYRVKPENFVVICTANLEPGRNFSGNNRRGMDDAFIDRVRIVRVERAPAEVIPQIVAARVDFTGVDDRAKKNMLNALMEVYKMAVSPEQRRIITTRSIMAIADAWVSLDPRMYSLSEVMQLELKDRSADTATLSALVTGLESRGF